MKQIAIALLFALVLIGCGAERNTYRNDNGDFPGTGDWK